MGNVGTPGNGFNAYLAKYVATGIKWTADALLITLTAANFWCLTVGIVCLSALYLSMMSMLVTISFRNLMKNLIFEVKVQPKLAKLIP
jgi:hypothetical protein